MNKLFKRQRRVCLLILAVLFMITLWFTVPSCYVATAETDQDAQEKLTQTIIDLIGELDIEELQNYLDSLSVNNGISIKDKILSVITGDFSLDYSSLIKSMVNLIWEETQSLFPAFAVILAVSLLCGILNSAKSGFMNSNMSEIINFVGYIAVGAVVLSCLINVLSSGFTAITTMQTQMEIIFPILLTLMAASGGTASVAVYRPAVAFMSGTITEIFSSIVMPLSIVVIILAFIGNLSNEVRTEKLGDFFKGINKWIIGFSLGLFTLFLTVQGIASSQYDGLSLRAVKYVISGSVPLVGGFLSGSVDFVLAGSALIKNALGAFSIFLLIATLLKPLMLLAVFQIFLRIAATATEPVGGKTSAFLSRLASDMGFFVAGLLCVAFLYFLTLLLLVCSSGVIF